MDRSWIPTTAGILDIVAGLAALLGAVALFFASFIVGHVPEGGDEFPLYAVEALLFVIGLGVLLGAAVAIVGGFFAIQRRRWAWAVAGAIAAALLCPPLGVPAIVLTVLAEKDLRQDA